MPTYQVLSRVNGYSVLQEKESGTLSVIPQQGRFAVVVCYMCDQNEPSKPDADIVFIPADKSKREAVLRELVVAYFGEDDLPEDQKADLDLDGRLSHPKKGDHWHEYADLVVDYGETYLLLTYVNLPETPALEGLCSESSSSS